MEYRAEPVIRLTLSVEDAGFLIDEIVGLISAETPAINQLYEVLSDFKAENE
jgi:hypothetical protein